MQYRGFNLKETYWVNLRNLRAHELGYRLFRSSSRTNAPVSATQSLHLGLCANITSSRGPPWLHLYKIMAPPLNLSPYSAALFIFVVLITPWQYIIGLFNYFLSPLVECKLWEGENLAFLVITVTRHLEHLAQRGDSVPICWMNE